MEQVKYKVYGYRWIVLLVYAFIQAVMQMLWITFAPITGDAAAFYHVTALQIGFLAMSFMIVYLFVSFPASWAIDTFGIRKGVGFGVILTGVFGLAAIGMAVLRRGTVADGGQNLYPKRVNLLGTRLMAGQRTLTP